MSAYYNEINPVAAQWLRDLIRARLIAQGDVDERSIEDVDSDDLIGYDQCHFFAGIGGWSLALRLAGVKDSQRLWTGSCPCQPYSIANVAHGGGRGRDDSRHLLPAFTKLIAKRKPPKIYGEQVANAIGKGWLDEAFGEMEKIGYACGAAVLPAIAFGARHERKRLFWVADAGGEGWEGRQQVECIPSSQRASFPVYGNPLADGWKALDGDICGLLLGDGVSVQLERDALKGYGNAIVPQVAAEFIKATA